jgi:16S rRNA (adenine1518-N6/adenine1519-N6)-dimethyltransferase
VRQRLGQHFLRDANVIRTLVAAAELKPSDRALEIGPGRAILTDAVAPVVSQLVAIELDDTLAAWLQTRFARRPNVRIIHGDILRVDLDVAAPEALWPVKVLGNLPYAITSPIFEKLFAWPGWNTGVFLIQKEVAERMQSAPGARAYGILTLAVQLFAEIEPILNVKPSAFQPPPEVMSQVVRLRRRPSCGLSEKDIPAFFDLAHAAFAHRRKTLANSLAMHAEKPKAAVEQWLQKRGISTGIRAEVLPVSEFQRLAPEWAIFRRETVI